MGTCRNAYRIVMEKPLGKQPLERHGRIPLKCELTCIVQT
jgi:hypothetical protein